MEEKGEAGKINRRNFGKLAAASVFATAGLLTSPEWMRETDYKEETIDGKKAGEEYARTVMPLGILLTENEKEKQKLLGAENKKKVTYRQRIEDYGLTMYLPDNYGDTDNRELTGLVKFMKEERPDLWAPINNVIMFAEDFGENEITRTMAMASGNRAISYVNTGEYPLMGRAGPGLYVEICQSLMFERSAISSKLTIDDREVWANTVGQAVWSAKIGESYEKYVDELNLELPAYGMGGEIKMKPVSRGQFEKIAGFVKKRER